MQKILDHIRRGLKANRQIVSNFVSLFLVQGVNFLVPIVIIPYIVGTIGIERFGTVSLIQVLIGYFIIIADYGFNLKGTRDIALNREHPEKLSHYISLILFLKVFLCLLCLVMLCIILLSVPKFGDHSTACLLAFPMVVGHTFNPVWFFQGIEQMKYITIVNILGKLLLLGFIIAFVHGPSDYGMVLFAYGLSFLLSSGTGIWIMLRGYHIRLSRPSRRDLYNELRNSFSFFLSGFSVNLYIHSNILILGFFTNDVITGVYSIIDKIIYAFRQVLLVFFQATYPPMCRMLLESRERVIRFQKTIFAPFILVVALGCIILWWAAPLIYALMSNGDAHPGAIPLLRALSFIPLVIALNIPANQTLLANDHKKIYSRILISAAAICLATNLLLAPRYGMFGTAVAVILTELYVTVGLHLALVRKERFPLLYQTFLQKKNSA